MRPHAFPWLVMTILLASVVGDWIFDKIAVLHTSGQGLAFYGSLLRTPWFWFGVATIPMQFWIWTRIIRNTDLSRVYPTTSMTYPITMLIGSIFFHEDLNGLVWIGALLITAGVAMIGFERGRLEPAVLSTPPETDELPTAL